MAVFNVEEIRNAQVNSVVDAGWYLVEIIDAKETESKQKHTPEVALEYSIVAGPEQVDGRVVEGRALFDHIYFPIGKPNDISNATVKKICLAAGVDLANSDNLLGDLIGQSIKVLVKHEDYKGEPQERIGNYKKAQ